MKYHGGNCAGRSEKTKGGKELPPFVE